MTLKGRHIEKGSALSDSLVITLSSSVFDPAVRDIQTDSAPTKDDECHSVEPGADVCQHPQEEAKLKAEGILKLLPMW